MADSEPAVITIQTGEYVAGKEQGIYTTLLGSCVSACLYDPFQRIAGMNHFLLATDISVRPAKLMDSSAGYYGIHAMELLINAMQHRGATRANIKAKIFGGANVLTHYGIHGGIGSDVGENNVAFLIEFLHRQGMPIISRDVGGNSGRLIFFNTLDYSVKVKTICHDKNAGVAKQTVNYLEEERAKQHRGTDLLAFLDRK